ncbi:helix-turn-helix domain-containing protein [Streptomyces sp. GQFP]|uniref:helix-turn-helix domain-containing protein n=1 Tax=Streptomyces sp. GQFP TaxID=2907545 RepID=UPI001F1FE482|nr:helix-turn-helix domain-containing protein [Streptomyces sp. GQFP]UIX33559.1 helix-turn-helix domain-containing protein [Streptomyces sp. GQFP]
MATTETTGALDLAERRATVRRLAADSLSNREIARRLGIHHRTVARDLEAPAPAAAPQTAPQAAPPAPTSGASPAPRRPSLIKELDPRLIQDLNVLVDRRTGALPAPLDRIVRAYADRTRAAWSAAMERRAEEEA